MKARRFSLDDAPLDRGTVLLEASAGTGKTYTIVGVLLRLLLEGGVTALERALVVTFTTAATEELKTRLRDGLERVLRAAEGAACDDPFFARLARREGAAARVRAALDDFDRVPIATIHGFCKRLLDESAFETRQPFRIDFVVDPLPLLHRAAADVVRRRYAPRPDPTQAVLTLAGLTPDGLVRAWLLWRRHAGIALPPDPPAAESHLRAIAAPLAAVAASCDDDVLAQLASLTWRKDKKNNPFVQPHDIEPELRQFAEQLRRDPVLALELVTRFAPSRLEIDLVQRSKRPGDHPFFAACDAVAAAVDAAVPHLRAQLLHDLDAALQRDKQRQHVMSFDDLLQRTHAALQDPERRPVLLAAIRERYEVALIDEFQDTDALQYEIFATCFARRPLFLVGDPKQSIYGFRGADLLAYFAARGDAAALETLDVNYRSSAPLVTAVAQLFAAPGAFVEDGIDLPPVRPQARPGELTVDGDDGPAFRWRLVTETNDAGAPAEVQKDVAEARIAADVAAEIARLLAGPARIGDRALAPRDCAVLTRTNRQAVRVQDALRGAGIVSAIGKAGDVFETDEITEVERLLRAVLQPRDLGLARAAMATRLWGRDAAWLRDTVDDGGEFDDGLSALDRWRRTWHRHGFVVMAEQLLAELDAVPRLLALRGGERSLTNFQQLFELLHQAEHEERLSPEGLLEWLQHERAHKDEIDYQLRELRLESDEDAVKILTVHGSKGLQYEVVFCPFLWDTRRERAPAIVPHGRERRLAFELDTDAKGAIETARLAEDVRLLYVALTRARRRCYVHIGAIGNNLAGAWRSSLAWLLCPPAPEHDPRTDPARFEDWCKATRPALRGLEARLEALCDASAGAMGVERVPAAPEAVPLPAPSAVPLAQARSPRRPVAPRALHSFTSLVAGAHALDPGPDTADPAAVPVAAPAPAGRGIFAFARGARAGQCLHTLLERIDLDALDGAPAERLVRATLDAYGLVAPAAHPGPIEPVADVLQNLRDLAAARVHDGGPTLAELARGPKAIEWKFTLPTPGSALEALADAFAEHGSPLARRYAERLRRLPARYLHGFLVGFVDLLATHGDRHWIVDWKSNHLGDRVADYGSDALADAMHDSDYVLQYHLYALALHRLLRARLRDYDYERHTGGICYAFLRGARPGATDGMLHDRVPRALVEAMDRWAGGGR